MQPANMPFPFLHVPFALMLGVCTLSAMPTASPSPIRSEPLPLGAVRLTGGPLKDAQDADATYLLALEPDRMMAGYRLRAGLEPKAEGYGGWDSVEGKQLTGHIAGHYLSAASLMYAATDDPRFKERVDYLIAEMKAVQDKRATGYLGALTDSEGRDAAVIFEQEVSIGDIRSGGFDLNGMWSPWYTLHKTYAGLRDAWRYAGNRTALDLEIRFAEWAERVLETMTEAQIQRMLNTEFGGMNEVFVDLYADTGDERWLRLSYQFEHHSFTDPLKRHQDILAGKHGNTQVPKLIGSADRYAYTDNGSDLLAAAFFWDQVVQHHSFATGGHGRNEYFGPPDQLNDRIDGRTAETCNVYNMLKLTRRLFEFYPDAHYADFHERALFNHILASIDPESGSTCYMVPVGRGVQHEYQDMFRNFTCCVGSGMESHALHGDGLYYESPTTLWVNLYCPSKARWTTNAEIEMKTDFPLGESATLTFTLGASKTFTLALRRPYWVGEAFSVSVNGEPLSPEELSTPVPDDRGGGRRQQDDSLPPQFRSPGYFVKIERTWNDGDTVEIHLPKSLRLEPLPDNPNRAAILWGPLVLAGDLGPEEERRRGQRARAQDLEAVPVLVAGHLPVEEWLRPVDDAPGRFRTEGVGRERDVDLIPLYQLHHRTYAVYWDFYTPETWELKAAEIAAERERQRQLDAITVAYVQPGEMQPERDFNQQGERSRPARVMGRPGRRAADWFSFDIPVEGDHPMALIVTYNHDEWRERNFELLVDGERIARQTVGPRGPQEFFDVEYPVPASLIENKERVTVKFQAEPDSETAVVFGIRIIRADSNH